MIARWIMVRSVVYGLRHDMTPAEALDAISRAFPRRTPAWRLELLADAQAKVKAAADGP